MATETVEHLATTGSTTLHLFPVGYSLSQWVTYARLLVERPAPDLGLYRVTVDTNIASQWAVFDTAVGTTWGQSLATWEAASAVSVIPVFGANAGTNRPKGANVVDTIYLREAFTFVRTLTKDKLPFSLTGKTLVFTVEHENSANKLVVRGGSIALSGTVNQTYSVVIPDTVTAMEGSVAFTLRDDITGVVYDYGKLEVVWAPHPSPD